MHRGKRLPGDLPTRWLIKKYEDEMKLIALTVLSVLLATAAHGENPQEIIKTGNCGGIRGGCRGFEIHSEGKVFSTEKLGATEKKQELCKDKKTAELLFQKLKKMKFTEIKLNETGNITAYITLDAEGKTHKVSWWQRDETTKPLNEFVEEELQLLREINCSSDSRQ